LHPHPFFVARKERFVKGKTFYLTLIVLFVIVTGLGCAALDSGLERPRVNIANVTPKEIKPFEQVFDLELRIQNRNDSELVINGLILDLEINDKPFATGISNQTLTLSRLSSDVIHAQATTSTWDMLRQIVEAQRTGFARVKYRLRGKIFAGSPNVKLPFDETGEIEIPFEGPRQ
jgi:LEA14-like dessication related protein